MPEPLSEKELQELAKLANDAFWHSASMAAFVAAARDALPRLVTEHLRAERATLRNVMTFVCMCCDDFDSVEHYAEHVRTRTRMSKCRSFASVRS